MMKEGDKKKTSVSCKKTKANRRVFLECPNRRVFCRSTANNGEVLDCERCKEISVPAGWLRILPEFGEGHKVVVRAIDWKGFYWMFYCAIRKRGRYKKPEFQSREWRKFVNQKRLTVGDKIVIWKEEDLFMGPMYRMRRSLG